MTSVIEDVARAADPDLWNGVERNPICAPNSFLHKSEQRARKYLQVVLSGPVGDVLREACESVHGGYLTYTPLDKAVHALPSEITDMLEGK